MATIAIFADGQNKGTCRSCGAPITWAETTQGKRIPFDGEIVAVRSAGSPLAGRVIQYVDTEVTKPHFATCPDSKDWRRR